MPTYTAPVKDMQFLLHDVLKINEADIPGYADLDRSFTQAVPDEAGKVAQDVLAPLNAVGATEGCALENGVVRVSEDARSLVRIIASVFDAYHGKRTAQHSVAV